MLRLQTLGILAAVALVMWEPASAQTVVSGAISGVVRDASGGVLPGVTVEAASPALIEKVRSVITDSQGVYRILDLRPGAYTVTFSLPGFSTLRRDGIELTTGFTATVNADLRVGTVEETVTVTGTAPVVDVQNVLQQKQFSREILDTVPMSTSTAAYATMIPGAMTPARDVGGNVGVTTGGHDFTIHGGRTNDFMVNQDGLQRNTLTGTGATGIGVSISSAQEVTVQTGGISAEAAVGGVQINVIPKDGGNTVSGMFEYKLSNGDMQSDNVSDELLARGLDPARRVGLKVNSFVAGGVGGPIRRDRLWFYASHQYWNVERWVPGVYWNSTHGTLRYTPDLSRPAFDRNYYNNTMLRLTWQATAKQKVTFSGENVYSCTCTQSLTEGTRSPEATAYLIYQPNYAIRAIWNYVATSRLLFEAASGPLYMTQGQMAPPGVPEAPQVIELSNNFRFNSRSENLTGAGNYGPHATNQWHGRFATSYVTGSHAFKTGFNFAVSDKEFYNGISGGGLDYRTRNGVPVSLIQWVQPHAVLTTLTDVGAYVQDQWTIRRLTLNLGLRFDSIRGYVPAISFPEGNFVPARSYAEVKNAPNWKDLNPRIGVAYDLFGNGRTALKASIGRYVALERLNATVTLNAPVNLAVLSVTRTWTDSNGNARPDCNLRSPDANAECGAMSDRAFGQPRITTTFSDDVLRGWRTRDSNWQGSVSVQHEFREGLAVDVGYYRTSHQNFRSTDNVLVTPADYDPYCVTAPADSRLPGGGGRQVCGLFDIKPAKFGQVESAVVPTAQFGKQVEQYNGVDASVRARFGEGVIVQGGMSVGRTVIDTCVVVDSPQALYQCRIAPPWDAGTQLKFLVVYPLPWNFRASMTYQNLPGVEVGATAVYNSAAISPSLGRNLSAGAQATVTLSVLPPATMYEERQSQVDLRLSRVFRLWRTQVTGNVDLFNLLNANTILRMNTRVGPAWLTPTEILDGRVVKLGLQVGF